MAQEKGRPDCSPLTQCQALHPVGVEANSVELVALAEGDGRQRAARHCDAVHLMAGEEGV